MNLNDAKTKIQNYLRSEKTTPLIVDVQTKKDLSELIDYFQVGSNVFPPAEQFCGKDTVLKIDELYDYVLKNSGNTFMTGLTGFFKLLGEKEANRILKVLVTTSISGHLVILTYQCKNYLKFSDSKIIETGRIAIVDGIPDAVTEIILVSPALAPSFQDVIFGIEHIGSIVENSRKETAYISTRETKEKFPNSVYHIGQLDNVYDYLCEKDPRTSIVPQSFGTDDNWKCALSRMGQDGNWSSVFRSEFGSEINLSSALASYQKFDKQKQWLYFIALSMCGVRENEYLQMAVNHAETSRDLLKSIFRTILTVDRNSADFSVRYHQRKELLVFLKDCLPEIVEYCKVVSVKGEDAIYYLTDVNQLEKERMITWLDSYGLKYERTALLDILRTVYPDLAAYLSTFRFKNPLLDHYVDAYKYQKVINHILPSFEEIVAQQSEKRDFVTALKPRSSIVEKLDLKDAKAFFFDALGVEYLGFIQEKCREYDLSLHAVCGRCELPSLTSFNKEFVETLNSKGCSVTDIKDLDEIKHHGEDNYDYEKQKTPLYLVRELEIIDELLKKIRAGIISGQYAKAVIVSDHGASRLAVLHETENIWSMATIGEHSGRCCRISETDSKPDYAVEESGFWVLTNYDRFKGGRRSNVEVHGGASLEEVAVPIIEITKKQTNIEAFIIDESRIITLGAGEHAVIRIYVGITDGDIAIKLNGEYFEAVSTDEPFVYSVDLFNYSKKGKYSFDIEYGGGVLAASQQFEIVKKGFAENKLFD